MPKQSALFNRPPNASQVHAVAHVSFGQLENYQIGKPIGQGAYATVYACYHKQTMQKCAIKIYQKVKLNDSMKRKAV